MRESTVMSALMQPCSGEQYNCQAADLVSGKDAPFEPELQSDCSATIKRRPRAAKDGRLRLRVSAGGFLTTLVLMLVATPFVRGLKGGPLYEVVLFTLVMCTGLVASGSHRRLPLALGSSALVAIWLNQLWPKECPALTFVLPATAFLHVISRG